MLSVKPWKTDAILRLGMSVFVCIYAGSLTLAAFRAFGSGRGGPILFGLLVMAYTCLGGALILVQRSRGLEDTMQRMVALLLSFYAGLLLGAWVQRLAGPGGPSSGQMLSGVLGFQGAALVLVIPFLREHRTNWREAFGLTNQKGRAILLGVVVACIFYPIGWELQRFSAEVMVRLPWLHLEPRAQQTVQILVDAPGWTQRLVLGLVTILLAPPAEEILFRGIAYPWIKNAGFPRLALWGTSLVFAAVHWHMPSFASLTLLALTLTLLYERTNNLLAPIVAHAMFNVLNFVELCWMERTLN